MPVAVGICIVFGVSCWLLFSREAKALIEAMLAGGFLLSLLAAICGFGLGNSGPQDSNFEIGSFLAMPPA